MAVTKRWTPEQLQVALNLYCQIPFGKLDSRNPKIIHWAGLIGRTPGALAMKLVNLASLDPVTTGTGRSGLVNASALDRKMWEEMQDNWDAFVETLKKSCSPCPEILLYPILPRNPFPMSTTGEPGSCPPGCGSGRRFSVNRSSAPMMEKGIIYLN